MSTDPNEAPNEEVKVENEAAATELVEVGAVSATEGAAYGTKPDGGIGVMFS